MCFWLHCGLVKKIINHCAYIYVQAILHWNINHFIIVFVLHIHIHINNQWKNPLLDCIFNLQICEIKLVHCTYSAHMCVGIIYFTTQTDLHTLGWRNKIPITDSELSMQDNFSIKILILFIICTFVELEIIEHLLAYTIPPLFTAESNSMPVQEVFVDQWLHGIYVSFFF